MKDKKVIEVAIELLKSTLGDMPSHRADKIVKLVADLLEEIIK